MKQKLIKRIGALVLSSTLLVSTAVTAFAADCANPNCGSINTKEVEREYAGSNFFNTDLHRVFYNVTYKCNDCHQEFTREEFEYEGHSYHWVGDVLKCTVCGDAYSN